MSTVYEAIDSIEPIADTLGEQWGNAQLYNVISGCVLAYDAADMTVDLGLGAFMHSGTPLQIATLANAFTLVSDPTNPRWTWLCLSSAGAPVVVSGTAAATPSVPELGDRTALALVYVQAGLTIAANATYKIDQRLPNPKGLIGYVNTATSTTSTSAVDLITISTLGFANSIPAVCSLRIVVNYRKQALAAQTATIGLKLNSTVVCEAGAVGTTYAAATSATQRAEDGICEMLIGPRTASYTSAFNSTFRTGISSSTFDAVVGSFGTPGTGSSPMPTAALTSLAIRAINNTTSNAIEVTEVFVYQN